MTPNSCRLRNRPYTKGEICVTYAMSDLHGCRALYESMLTTIRLKERDTL